MLPEIARSSGNSEVVIDPEKVLTQTQGIWTLETLGIQVQGDLSDETDFDRDLDEGERNERT